jgi:flagellar hook-associated protein 3 FlgL
MRILFDVMRDGLSAINTAAEQMDAARQQVASGKRILQPSDDALGTQMAIGEHATLGSIDAYRRSADSAAARLAAADSVMTAIVDKITAAIVTGTSARGSEVEPSARAAMVQELQGLRDSLVGDFNTTFNGSSLFAGTATDATAFANVGGVWTYQGNSATAQIQVDRGRLVSVTFDGQAIAQGSDPDNLFTTIDDLVTAIQAGDATGMGDGIDALERAFDRAVQAQGRLGADERGVDEAGVRLSALRASTDKRRSALEDANLAEAMTRMTQADTAYRAALGAVSTAERLSLLDYLE